MLTLTIKDETAHGKTLRQLELSLPAERIPVRELIRQRVYAEVEAYNQRAEEYFQGLVQPADAEVTLNGYRLRQKRYVDAEKQFYVALDAFLKNGFFILVNDRQAETLEEELLVSQDTRVSFLKLTQLVGG